MGFLCRTRTRILCVSTDRDLYEWHGLPAREGVLLPVRKPKRVRNSHHLRNMSEPFFKKYTDLIDHRTDLTSMMRDQGKEISQWLGTISDPESMLIHTPYTWTLKEVVNHLSDCERVFAFRALWIARGGAMPLVSFDEIDFSHRGKANDFTIAALANEFQAVRQSTLTFFQNLPESAWQNIGHVIGHEVTVHKQATILLGHVAHHWRIVQQRFGVVPRD